MAIVNKITGVYSVVAELKRYTNSMAVGVGLGLREAGVLLQKESQKSVPIEFGNLRASAYTIARGAGFGTSVDVGYTASYALYVHEKVGMVLRGQPRRPSPPHIGKYWDPQGQGQAKFLEAPARRLAPQLIRIIVARARLRS